MAAELIRHSTLSYSQKTMGALAIQVDTAFKYC